MLANRAVAVASRCSGGRGVTWTTSCTRRWSSLSQSEPRGHLCPRRRWQRPVAKRAGRGRNRSCAICQTTPSARSNLHLRRWRGQPGQRSRGSRAGAAGEELLLRLAVAHEGAGDGAHGGVGVNENDEGGTWREELTDEGDEPRPTTTHVPAAPARPVEHKARGHRPA